MSVIYIKNAVEHKDKDPKFNVVNHVRITKYKNIFAKKKLHCKLVRRSFFY